MTATDTTPTERSDDMMSYLWYGHKRRHPNPPSYEPHACTPTCVHTREWEQMQAAASVLREEGRGDDNE